MPTAKKTKSGSWHCIGYSGRDEYGKRTYKSFTVRDPTRRGKKECERQAAEWAAGHKDKPPEERTVQDAVRKYIDMKKPVLSPSTIRGYELYLKKRMQPISDVSLQDLTASRCQLWVNDLASECSTKYIKNVYGLFRAALEYSGSAAPHVTYPGAPRRPLYTPCDADIQILLKHIRGRPELFTAVLLAAFGSMRRGEICALKREDIVGNRVTVCRSMVRDIDCYWHIKPFPKTDESNRIVVLPDGIPELLTIPIKLHPEQVSNRFRRAVRSCGCQRIFRFHDLRHYYVSIAHALGIPDAYIMRMGGWKSDTIMHRVYRDTLPDIMQSEQKKLNSHFNGIIRP